MSTLSFERKKFPCVDFNGENELPAWNKTVLPTTMHSELDEDDELFINYGRVAGCHPYREQNLYTHTLEEKEMLWATLENKYLRATFAPECGGKLWSLFDKVAGKELLFANPVNKPCNLAIRNAWTSGGVEWNCGFVGHHPHTCDTMFTARTVDEKGEPVLRFYAYERVRNVNYQIDFSLPETSCVLMCHMRIVNPNDTVVPMYWWSNMAVPEEEGARVIIPAHATYTNIKNTVVKLPIPVTDYTGIKAELPETATPFDVTYPMNSPVSIDYFWKLDKNARRFTCQLDKKGYGLFQASTDRLKGRKLFVWGQGPGGNRWQEYLSGNGSNGHYVEIQAGLACSQYEALPMPPHTAWEWEEIYGAMTADPKKVHGEWDGAIAEVEARLDEIMTAEELEAKLKADKKIALTRAEDMITFGSGWGALEEKRRANAGAAPAAPQLDFGYTDDPQDPWLQLLETGVLPETPVDEAPGSWMIQPEWVALLEKAAQEHPNWLVWVQLGGARLTACDIAGAEQAFTASLKTKANAWAQYGLSCCAMLKKDSEKAVEYALLAHNALPEHSSLALHALQMLYDTQQWKAMVRVEAGLNEETRQLPRIQMLTAFACVYSGDLSRAEQILNAGDGLEVPDIREGEVSVTGLWYALEEAKAARDGKPFDKDTAIPPHQFDFRMFAPKKKK